MKLNWESISYIFQIPLLWFKDVDRRLNLFGDGKILTADRNNPDGTRISLDIDALKDALKEEPKAETSFSTFETPTAATGTIPSNHQNNVNLNTTWTRGGSTGTGVKVYLPFDSWDTGARRIYAWRLCEFDRYGRLQKIYAQTIQTDAVSVDQL